MSTQNIALTVIGSSVSHPVQLSKQSAFRSQGMTYILLQLASPTHIKNLIIKNASTPFLTILAGDAQQAKRLRRSVTRQQHCLVFEEMQTLMCETQMCSTEQYSTKHKQCEKIRSIRAFNRCVNHSRAVFSCLAVLMRPFPDLRDTSVGLGWIECYGEVKSEADELAATQLQQQKTKQRLAKLDAARQQQAMHSQPQSHLQQQQQHNQKQQQQQQQHSGMKRSSSPVQSEAVSPNKRAKLVS